MSLCGWVFWGAVCLGAGCAFDPNGVNGNDEPFATDGGPPLPPPPAPDASAAADAAVPVPPPPGELRCLRIAQPPVFDGLLGDWSLEGIASFGMANAAQVLDETLLYNASMTTTFRCAHDETRLYFAVQVLDDRQVVDSTLLYQDDAVSLYLDARGDASGPFGPDDHELVVRADGLYVEEAAGAAPVRLVGKVLADPPTQSFTIEIAIDKASLGAGATLPARLGFDLALSDDDGLGAFAYGLWYVSPRPSCPGCCTAAGPRAWCDTTTLGSLVLD